MFKKLLNVGKGHSSDKLQQQLQQQQQQKSLFQFNEIKSYGFSKFTCLAYSPSLSLIAAGSPLGQLSVFGGPTVEFTYHLPASSDNGIRQIEFIDCRPAINRQVAKLSAADKKAQEQPKPSSSVLVPAKLIVLTNTSHLHLFELRNIEPQNFADSTTQTETNLQQQDCCTQQQNNTQTEASAADQAAQIRFTKLVHVGKIDYFKFKLGEDEDKSKRVTTIEISADNAGFLVGTESGNLYQIPLSKFEASEESKKQQVAKQQTESVKQQQSDTDTSNPPSSDVKNDQTQSNKDDAEETTAVNLNDEPQIGLNDDGEHVLDVEEEPFDMIKYENRIAACLGDEIKPRKQGAIESIRRHPLSNDKILISYHRGLNVIYNLSSKALEKYFYHNETIECSCFADQLGDFFYTSHTDGSYVKWDTRVSGNQATANEESVAQLYGPYPCKPTPKIQACTGLVNDQLEDLIVFSGGMPRATYDDKHPVTIVHTGPDGKDTIKTVLDFSSKVLDFVIITRPRGQLGAGAKSTGCASSSSSAGATGGGGKKNKNKQQKEQMQLQQQQQRPIAVALAVLAEEEFVVIDLLNSESYLEFALPYLNCVHSSAITFSEHCSNVSDELYEQMLAYNKRESKGKLSPNGWPITGGKVTDAQAALIQVGDGSSTTQTHDLLITGHEDGSINIWDVTELSMRHLIYLQTSRYFAGNEDDDLPLVDGVDSSPNRQERSGAGAEDSNLQQQQQDASTNDNSASDPLNEAETAWPPLKRVGRFDPFSDDTRLAIRKVRLCPQTGTLVIAGTGGQVLVFELRDEPAELSSLAVDHEIAIVQDQRFVWKGKGKLLARSGLLKFQAGSYHLSSYVQLNPPASPTSLDLRSDWRLFALGTSYGFILYDYGNKQPVISRCTLNVQDFAIISGDAPGAGAMSRKKSFRKSLRESFRRLRRGRSQRNQPVTGTSSAAVATTGVSSSPSATGAVAAGEQQAPVRPAFSRLTTGVRTLNAPSQGSESNQPSHQSSGFPQVPRSVYANERQVEQKVDLGSIVKCITLTSCVITSTTPAYFTPSLWVGTNSGLVLVYAITLASAEQTGTLQADVTSQSNTKSDESTSTSHADSSATASVVQKTSAKLTKEIQLKHRAPIVAIFTSPEEPSSEQQSSKQQSDERSASSSKQSTPEKQASELMLTATDSVGPQQHAEAPADEDRHQTKDGRQTPSQQERAGTGAKLATASKQQALSQPARVLICTEEQFKVFNLPNLKPFCKFKLTAHEGLRAKAISITQFLKPTVSPSLQQQQQQQQQTNKQAGSSLPSLAASKSSQSFATQTSPPSSPVPPVEGGDEPTSSSQQNGPSTSLKQSESNNNSITALNKNHTSVSKDLLNAKFGANTAIGSKSNPVDRDQSAMGDLIESSFMLEPYMVCMSNQGDCAVYSVPDLKRQAQIQVCKREDVNGIDSTMLTQFGEGFYLRSSLNFLRFSISSQRVLRSLALVS